MREPRLIQVTQKLTPAKAQVFTGTDSDKSVAMLVSFPINCYP